MESSERFVAKPNGNLPAVYEPSLFLSAPSQPAGPVFTWEQAVRILRKNGRFALLLALLLIAGVVGLAMMMKDVYQPVARLQIDPVNNGIKAPTDAEEERITESPDFMETQAQILRSDGLGVSVIRELHLD